MWTLPEDRKPCLRMVGRGLLTAMVLCLSVGCASQRDQRLKGYREIHRDIREGPEQPAGEWTLKSKE